MNALTETSSRDHDVPQAPLCGTAAGSVKHGLVTLWGECWPAWLRDMAQERPFSDSDRAGLRQIVEQAT